MMACVLQKLWAWNYIKSPKTGYLRKMLKVVENRKNTDVLGTPIRSSNISTQRSLLNYRNRRRIWLQTFKQEIVSNNLLQFIDTQRIIEDYQT